MKQNYFKKIFKDNYVPYDEIQKRIEDTVEFSVYLTKNPDKLDLIYDWMLHFYFYGLDENSTVVMFEEDLKRFAKDGYTAVPLVFHEAIGSIAENSPLGFVADVWDPQSEYALDYIEREYVTELLEKTKIKCDDYCFLSLNWDYFFENCWADVMHEVFEYYYGTTYQRAVDNIINQKINKMLKNEGLKLTYIKELSPNPAIPSKRKLSCIGFDMTDTWPKSSYKDLIVKI